VPELRVVFLDAGQGDSTLVVFPNGQLMLVDCGSTKNRQLAEETIAQGIENYMGVPRRIEQVVVTHADEDHYNLLGPVMTRLGNPAVGGVRYGGDINLYKNIREGNVAYNWLVANNALPFGPSHFGGAAPTTIGPQNPPQPSEEAKLYVLAANSTGYPPLRNSKGKNTNSVVLLIEYDRYKVFLMGDATKATEQFILGRAAQMPAVPGVSLLQRDFATSLKMGHHGSITSSGQPWVTELKPDAFFISADTKPFGRGGGGMPPIAFLREVLGWSPNVYEGEEHGVVAFSEPPARRFDAWQTKKSVYSTLQEILYNNAGLGFDAGGGSWHLVVKWGEGVEVIST
jgi:beta-lactamase superfamily II metal-dependent hydrolase